MKTAVLLSAFLAGCGVFLLYTYNSGYGYDAVEYLVLGRSLLDGYDVFHFSPSKSPGIFYLVAGFLSLWPDAGHGGISLLITAIFAAVVAGVYAVLTASHGRTAAVIGAGLAAVSCFFMEMNFLETEGFVFLLSLPALPVLRSGLRSGRWPWFVLAGLWIGAACFFKTVALFYVLGAGFFIVLWNRKRSSRPFAETATHLAAMAAGVALATGLPMAYYAATGRLQPYLHWTYMFPALHYPSDTVFAAKLITKLAWFFLLLLLSLLLLFHPRVRTVFKMSCYPGLALALGLAALLALAKNQASHYVVPAAGFLSIFMGIVFGAAISASPWMKRTALVLLCTGAVAIPVSACLYRPAAVRRLLTIKNYRAEEDTATRLQALCPEDGKALLFGHPLLYWLAHRYPNIPYVMLHVQFAHGLRADPLLLTRALKDPALALVEFNPAWPGIRAPGFLTDPEMILRLLDFDAGLRESFEPLAPDLAPYRFWLRKDRLQPRD